MARFKPLTQEIAAPTSAGTASTVGAANVVRAVNTSTSGVLVTLVDADGATVGSATVMGNEVVYIDKPKTYKVFAGANTVKLTSVSYPV